jgi:hypothetical protein
MSKKDTFYFSHDYNARNDEKIIELIMVHGMQGYGIYWSIVENLYNNANALQTHYKRIAFELRVSEDIIKSIINEFNLFTIEGDFFYSSSVSERLEKRTEISENARNAANKRWSKNADAMPTHSESNADAMQKKVKERKEIDINTFTFNDFWKIYPNKIAKDKCEKKFDLLLNKEKESIKATLNKFISYKPFPEYNHPHPMTYLSQKRWNDIIPDAVQAPKEETEREFRLRTFNERNGL